MAAALECWSGRPSTDEDMVEQVLMKTHHRSELLPPPPIKKWHRLGRSLTSAIASLKSTLNLDTSPSTSTTSARFDKLWSGVVRSFTQLSPASPDCLISNMNRHFDSLPNSYAQAGFDMKEVLLHVRLIEQAAIEDRPVVHIKEQQDEGAIFKLAFACNGQISWPAMSGVLDTSLICCKKIQIFEKKGLTLGVITLLVQSGTERQFKLRIEAALRAAIKKPRNMGVKLPFGLCGCQEEGGNNLDEDDARLMGDNPEGDDPEANRQKPKSSLVVSVDEWQTMRSGGEEMGRWVLGSEEVEFGDRTGPSSFKGGHRGKRVWIKKLRGCERGNAYEVEVWQELLKLMSCGNRNILQFHGICIEEKQGLCVVTRMMEGGSVHDLIQKSRKVSVREVVKIAMDVAAGLKFMNDHGVAYRDLNVQRILLDRQGNACLGDMGVVTSLGNAGEVTEYETAGYRWLAPEIIAGDPESVTETWMSNVYSFGMVVWEMVTGEAAYSSYSPVQAAVGIAACGLRPDIPGDCPQLLRSLMLRCWNNSPAERPQFSEIITILQRYSYR